MESAVDMKKYAIEQAVCKMYHEFMTKVLSDGQPAEEAWRDIITPLYVSVSQYVESENTIDNTESLDIPKLVEYIKSFQCGESLSDIEWGKEFVSKAIVNYISERSDIS